MIRAIALTIALLFGVGVLVPLATEPSEAGPRKPRKKANKGKQVKKYSRQWWRAYRLRQSRRKGLTARKRALRLRQIRLARQQRGTGSGDVSKNNDSYRQLVREESGPAVLPSGEAAPKTWKRSQSTPAELQFRVEDGNGHQLGTASIALVGPAQGQDAAFGRIKTVGGVPTTSLRRGVIDRMISENGWVVNDFVKEIGGRKVYVVVAQTEENGGAIRSRVFYFTEVDGRIYSVSTNAPQDTSARLVEESEKVISSLVRKRKNVQQAGLK